MSSLQRRAYNTLQNAKADPNQVADAIADLTLKILKSAALGDTSGHWSLNQYPRLVNEEVIKFCIKEEFVVDIDDTFLVIRWADPQSLSEFIQQYKSNAHERKLTEMHAMGFGNPIPSQFDGVDPLIVGEIENTEFVSSISEESLEKLRDATAEIQGNTYTSIADQLTARPKLR